MLGCLREGLQWKARSAKREDLERKARQRVSRWRAHVALTPNPSPAGEGTTRELPSPAGQP